MRIIEEGLQGNERVIVAGLLKVHAGGTVSLEWGKPSSGTGIPAEPGQTGAKP
jgi:hypothetical protein